MNYMFVYLNMFACLNARRASQYVHIDFSKGWVNDENFYSFS